MPLEIDFVRILVELGRQNGAKLAPASHQKSIPTLTGNFMKEKYLSLQKTMIWKVLGVEVGSQNESKIDQKNEVMMEKSRFWFAFEGSEW